MTQRFRKSYTENEKSWSFNEKTNFSRSLNYEL